MILHEEIATLEKHGVLPQTLPYDVVGNLAPGIALRPYQERALTRFLWKEDQDRDAPLHVLFHMATGSGKTVVMAAAMLHLYAQGHRNFLFFVNSSQIVEKTRANFVDPASPKHLFARPVRIGDETVPVRAVHNFDDAAPDAINIVFTTIQGLHTVLNTPKENGVTYEDFKDRRVVLISDEAHHINALTKKKPTDTEMAEERSWEHTVRRLLAMDDGNILLEFSATVDMAHPDIAAKYADKMLMDYPLRAFRADGYSKDIELRQADLSARDRMLHAIILSEHRRALARDLLAADWKPVVMMKSGVIKESNANEAAFHAMVASLDGNRLRAVHAAARDGDDKWLLPALDKLTETGSHDDLALVLQGQFAEERCTNVNAPADLGRQQILLNTLEASDNPIRCIFAVDKLDEGWDVLNLFDIVRLSDKGGTGRKPAATTMREAQLIGRGARYYPFADPDDAALAAGMRKYDADLRSPKRPLEQMLYHCTREVKYIQDLRKALLITGALDESERTVTLRVKPAFKETDVFKGYSFWSNERVPVRKAKRKGNDILSKRDFQVELPPSPSSAISHAGAFEEDLPVVTSAEPWEERTIRLREIGLPVLRRACDENPKLRFSLLRQAIPALASLRAFLTGLDHAGDVDITVRGPKDRLDPMAPSDALHVARDVLGKIALDIDRARAPEEGSDVFHPHPIAAKLVDREVKLTGTGETVRSWADSLVTGTDFPLADAEWHVFDDCYGTSEEKAFLVFIAAHADAIRDVFPEFYVIRNDKAVKLYETGGARATEPDYILVMRRTNDEAMCRHVFIEPKGEHLWNDEQWKSGFLDAICYDADDGGTLAPEQQQVRGLPFFNDDPSKKKAFRARFEKLVG